MSIAVDIIAIGIISTAIHELFHTLPGFYFGGHASPEEIGVSLILANLNWKRGRGLRITWPRGPYVRLQDESLVKPKHLAIICFSGNIPSMFILCSISLAYWAGILLPSPSERWLCHNILAPFDGRALYTFSDLFVYNIPVGSTSRWMGFIFYVHLLSIISNIVLPIPGSDGWKAIEALIAELREEVTQDLL